MFYYIKSTRYISSSKNLPKSLNLSASNSPECAKYGTSEASGMTLRHKTCH